MDKFEITYIYTQSVRANSAPKHVDQHAPALSRQHRSLRERLDRLSTPDGPSRPSVPLSVCQDCLLASLLPHCCRVRCLGPFPWPVVTQHQCFVSFFFLPVLSNARNDSSGVSFLLHLQHIGRPQLSFSAFLNTLCYLGLLELIGKYEKSSFDTIFQEKYGDSQSKFILLQLLLYRWCPICWLQEDIYWETPVAQHLCQNN